MEKAVTTWKMESPRGNMVNYGCSLSIMPYMTFALIGIYTAINVNNVS